jgi:hypothetical protein
VADAAVRCGHDGQPERGIAAKDQEIASLREHVAEVEAAREVGGSSGGPATPAIDDVLAMIDDPARWLAAAKAARACKALRKALVAAIDAIKTGQ